MGFADLISPVTPERFMRDSFDRQPLHVPAAGSARTRPLDWQGFNALLGVRSHWTPGHIELILNGRKVGGEQYLDELDTLAGRVQRADPAKVALFLAMGASMVGNSVEDISPIVRAVTTAISAQFSGRAGANVYCSMQGIRAFPSHCDLHEVFAVQCEGTKDWTIYANRAAAPVETVTGTDAQAIIDAAKGPAAMKVTMRPGDLLYIPRGFYHDALASSDASLHVTFSVAPLTGRILFRLIEALAIEDRAFREYLPDARDGDALARRIEALADRLGMLARSGRLRSELETQQRAQVQRADAVALPERAQLSFFARTERKAELKRDFDTVTLVSGSEAIDLGALQVAAEWLLGRPAFSIEELAARFPACDGKALSALVRRIQDMGLIVPYRPGL